MTARTRSSASRSSSFIGSYPPETFAKAGQFGVVKLCAALGVSTSGYYAWKRRPPTAHEVADQKLRGQIRELGLIRFGGQFDYAATPRAALSNSAGEAYPMAECIRSWL